MDEYIALGNWTKDKLEHLMKQARKINEAGSRIDFISRQFLNTKYKESTLIGDINTPEVFVINLEGVDCFTFIDYVEAMRLSGSYSEFKENLKRVRYRQSKVDFKNRNHFFTDWQEHNSEFAVDFTKQIGGKKTRLTAKTLNLVQKGIYLIEGIPSVKRDFFYIPSEAISSEIIKKIKTGDYIGIYSKAEGLDVSHVGIAVRKGSRVIFRHASSENRKVIDQDFKDYLSDKPGLIVLRPKD